MVVPTSNFPLDLSPLIPPPPLPLHETLTRGPLQLQLNFAVVEELHFPRLQPLPPLSLSAHDEHVHIKVSHVPEFPAVSIGVVVWFTLLLLLFFIRQGVAARSSCWKYLWQECDDGYIDRQGFVDFFTRFQAFSAFRHIRHLYCSLTASGFGSVHLPKPVHLNFAFNFSQC